MTGRGFAVIDFETTGLWRSHHDRVVEVAIVDVESDGSITTRWDTLINPERDLGPQRIHRVRAADVLEAPTFAEVAPLVIESLRGRVPVAHNANFDSRVLFDELERAGIVLWQRPEFLCTMQLAGEVIPGAGRSLQDCCDAFDISLDDAHRASADAMATARVLQAYLRLDPDHARWIDAMTRAADFPWPEEPRSSNPRLMPRPEIPTEITAESFLRRITLKMPDHSGTPEHRSYLALLDQALLDRRISVHESDALVRCAEDLGIGRIAVEALHEEYFRALTAVAWADDVLTDAELEDLLAVADLLDLPNEITVECMRPPIRTADDEPQDLGVFALRAGDRVVLTGEMSRSRDTIEAEIKSHGLVPWDAITKQVRLLIAADPDSLSGKAKKARDYGIPIVDEQSGISLVRQV